MNLKNSLVVLLVFITVLTACKPDDPTFIPVPDRDRTEQQVLDSDSLIGYLETHYYNSAALSAGGTDTQ